MDRLRNWMRGPEPVAVIRAAPVAGVTSGRPTYAALTGASILPREQNFQLLAQFRANVPLLKRATEILAGFVGVPELVVDGNDAATLWLHDWSNDIEYGDGVGRGLAVWQNALITQALVYGFSVGEVEIGASRQGVVRLWDYLSPSIVFETNAAGALDVVQSSGRTKQKLNPETICRVTHGPMGCNPNGESMLLALPLYCQTVLDIIAALRATWRRSGIPTYHVNWEPPDSLSDQTGEAIMKPVRQALEASWNEAMRSQIQDGIAKDFYSAGKISVTVIGADSVVMEADVPCKLLLEQIVAATGIPPMLFGLSWSTTERMSKQQADLFMQTIEGIRREIEPAIRKAVDTHVRLSGRRDALKWHCRWPDVSLQDQVQTAQAANLDAQAALASLKFWTECWRLGLVDQETVAMEVCDLDMVDRPMDEPPAAAPALQEPAQPNTDDGGQDANGLRLPSLDLARKILAEAEAEYPGLGRCAHNGKH